MADPWSEFSPSSTATGDPWAEFKPQGKQGSRLGELASTVTDIPSQVKQAYQRPISSILDFAQWLGSEPAQKPLTRENLGELATGFGKGASALGGAVYLGSGVGPAIEGALKSVMGHGTGAIFGTQPVEAAGGKTPTEIGMGEAEKLQMMLGQPTRAMIPGARAVPAPPPINPFESGIPGTSGYRPGIITQRGEVPSGKLSDPAAQRKAAFEAQLGRQVGEVRGDIAAQMSPYGTVMAERPVQAGGPIQETLRTKAAEATGETEAGYEAAKASGGEVHTSVFEGIGQKIKGDLSFRKDPVRISPNLTPVASEAIDLMDRAVSELKIINKADPFGRMQPFVPPGAKGVSTHVNLEGIDQWERELNRLYGRAKETNNASDVRAVRAIRDAFKKRVDDAIDSKLFLGDPKARELWKEARKLSHQERITFKEGSDEAEMISKIIRTKSPMQPEDVADAFLGTGLNPSWKHTNALRHMQEIVGGRDTPEMEMVRQSLFLGRLAPEGATPMQVQKNISNFLYRDGSTLSKVLYNDDERAAIRAFADVQNRLGIVATQTSPGWLSRLNTRLSRRIALQIGSGLGGAGVGFATGGPMGAVAGFGSGLALSTSMEAIGLAAKGAKELRQISRALPLVGEEWQRYLREVSRAQRFGRAADLAKLSAGTSGLNRALGRLGVSSDEIFGPAAGRAEDQQDRSQRRGDKEDRRNTQDQTHYGGPME